MAKKIETIVEATIETVEATVETVEATVEAVETVEAKVNKRVRVYSAGEEIIREAKMPLQLTQILDFLVNEKFKGTGTEIIQAMIDQGKITTRQNPAVLFAFYARRLEGMGIVRG